MTCKRLSPLSPLSSPSPPFPSISLCVSLLSFSPLHSLIHVILPFTSIYLSFAPHLYHSLPVLSLPSSISTNSHYFLLIFLPSFSPSSLPLTFHFSSSSFPLTHSDLLVKSVVPSASSLPSLLHYSSPFPSYSLPLPYHHPNSLPPLPHFPSSPSALPPPFPTPPTHSRSINPPLPLLLLPPSLLPSLPPFSPPP